MTSSNRRILFLALMSAVATACGVSHSSSGTLADEEADEEIAEEVDEETGAPRPWCGSEMPGEACTYEGRCTAAYVDFWMGRCGSIEHACESGVVVEHNNTFACMAPQEPPAEPEEPEARELTPILDLPLLRRWGRGRGPSSKR